MHHLVYLLMETFAHNFAAHQNMHSRVHENVLLLVPLDITQTQKIMVMEMESN